VLKRYSGHTSWRVRWSLFFLALLPGVLVMLPGGNAGVMLGADGRHWPFLPLVLSALFIYFASAVNRARTRQIDENHSGLKN